MPSQPDIESLARFRSLLRQFLDFSAEEARAAGVEPRHHQLLLVLRGLPAGVRPTIGALAEQLLIRHHSATELVDRMQKQGLVNRHTAEEDARLVLVEITPHGEAILGRLSATHRDELQRRGPALIAALQDVLSTREPGPQQERAAHGSGDSPD